MINNIVLKGLLRNVEFSHSIGDIQFYKANLVVKRNDGHEDVINIKCKKYIVADGEQDKQVELKGNIRSYTHKEGDKNKVDIYVFTYFDKPDEIELDLEDSHFNVNNYFTVEGRICKKNDLRIVDKSKETIHFILANTIANKDRTLNNYLPCIAWGSMAKKINDMEIGKDAIIKGEIHSREYKKILDNGEIEIRIAHELLVKEIHEL